MTEAAIDWRVPFAPPVFPVASLPEPEFTWAEIISIHAYKEQPAHDLPERLPDWIVKSPERLAFLRTAPLSQDKVRGMIRSPATFAKRVCETAEGMASEFDRDDKRRPRSLSFDQCQRLLFWLLPLADRCQGIDRPFLDSVRARREDLRAEQRDKRTKRRTELISLYSFMLRLGLPLRESDLYGDEQHLSARDKRIKREVAQLLRDEGRPRHVRIGGTNPHVPNAVMWDPPATPAPVTHYRVQTAPLFAFSTKTQTIPGTCNETGTSASGLPVRAFDHVQET